MTNNAIDTAGTITSVQAEHTSDVNRHESKYDLPQSAVQLADERTVVERKISILLCGNTQLDTEGVVEKLHVVEELGRRKLKSKDFDADAYVGKADVLWLTPKKHWTVSNSGVCRNARVS